jgi:hypothetical protein|tara:strand:- start:692 stop:904 length:213 start_codon:yes stop_codon:yes gene_type:complete
MSSSSFAVHTHVENKIEVTGKKSATSNCFWIDIQADDSLITIFFDNAEQIRKLGKDIVGFADHPEEYAPE